MGENRADDKEYKGQAEQVDMGDADQGKDIHPRILLRCVHDLFKSFKAGYVRIAIVMARDATFLDDRLDFAVEASSDVPSRTQLTIAMFSFAGSMLDIGPLSADSSTVPSLEPL